MVGPKNKVEPPPETVPLRGITAILPPVGIDMQPVGINIDKSNNTTRLIVVVFFTLLLPLVFA
jgi:hypothetical protein